MNANRFFWDSHWLEIWSNHFCPSMGLNGGSVATDSESRQGRSEPKVRDEFHFCWGEKKVFFFTGLNGFYLLMLLTE
jgi:hypothetical protein